MVTFGVINFGIYECKSALQESRTRLCVDASAQCPVHNTKAQCTVLNLMTDQNHLILTYVKLIEEEL